MAPFCLMESSQWSPRVLDTIVTARAMQHGDQHYDGLMREWNCWRRDRSIPEYAIAHGKLTDPPNRASIWRYGYDSPRDTDDASMNCGGIFRHHTLNSGKCGNCGDPYDEHQPRAHELGGKYGVGYIVAHYKEGQVISTKVDLKAGHLGSWELRICPDPYNQKQECFDNGYLLELETGGTKYRPERGSSEYNVTYRLPVGLTCKHCVLQWLYTSGNNWGYCPDGTSSPACAKQEHFYSCADIAIEEDKLHKISSGPSREDYSRYSKISRRKPAQ